MSQKINFIQITLVTLLFSITCGCQSNTTIEKNLSPAEYFQRARDATVAKNYQLAMQHYKTFVEEYNTNDDLSEVQWLLWADYEIAFLYHKMNDDEKAIDLLNKLIARYETNDSEDFPIGPKNLSQRVIRELKTAQTLSE